MLSVEEKAKSPKKGGTPLALKRSLEDAPLCRRCGERPRRYPGSHSRGAGLCQRCYDETRRPHGARPEITRVVPIRGRVEVRSIPDCPRIMGSMPVQTCLTLQGEGCWCHRAESLMQLMIHGWPMGGDDSDERNEDLEMSEAGL